MKALIDPKEVHAAFMDCLYKDDEIKTRGVVPNDAVLVEGLTINFGFHPERLKSKKDKVRKWLSDLPVEFRLENGGGWTMLNACNDKMNNLWTGSQSVVDELFCMAIGLNMAQYVASRSMWPVLPGGLPYVAITLEEKI